MPMKEKGKLTHAQDIPEGYLNKNLDNLNVTTPPENFMMPAWAGGNDDRPQFPNRIQNYCTQ